MTNITRRIERLEDSLTVEGKTKIVWLEPGETAESVGATVNEGDRLLLVSWVQDEQ